MTGPCKNPLQMSRYIIQLQIQMPRRPREKTQVFPPWELWVVKFPRKE